MNRRKFLKYFGVGVVGPTFTHLFGLRKKADETLTPYVAPPEGVLPGIPTYYSTVCRQCPAGCGAQVKIREGRAKKMEGNPEFPVNYGKLCARGQAALQVLYNPDRIRTPLIRSGDKFKKISWDEAIKLLVSNINDLKESGEADKSVFLSEPLRGSLGSLVRTFMDGLGSSQVYAYEHIDNSSLVKSNELCFGQATVPHYDVKNASYILSLGAGFLDTWVSPVQYSYEFGQMRDRHVGENGRGWITHFEPRMSLTAANADEWHPSRPGSEGLVALAIAHELIEEGLHTDEVEDDISGWKKVLSDYSPKKLAEKTGVSAKTIKEVAHNFGKNKGLALCGHNASSGRDGTFNSVAVNLLNHLVGSVNSEGGVRFSPTGYQDRLDSLMSYGDLVGLLDQMRALEVKLLMTYNVNPVFNLPPSAGIVEAMREVPFKVSFSSFLDETAALADLILPDHSPLESWGDYVPLADHGRNVIALQQQTITPLWDTRQVGDTLIQVAQALGSPVAEVLPQESYYDYLLSRWTQLYESQSAAGRMEHASFDDFWNASLQKGGWWADDSSYLEEVSSPTPELLEDFDVKPEDHPSEGEFDLLIYPSHGLYDGRGANQWWLQELPEPMVTATWSSWLEVGPETAEEMDLDEGDLVRVETESGSVEVPVYVYQAIGPEVVAMPLGQGHTSFGKYAEGVGANAGTLLSGDFDSTSGGLNWTRVRAKVMKAGTRQRFVKSEPLLDTPGLEHGLRELGRHIIQAVTPDHDEELSHEDHELEPIKALPTRDFREGEPFPPVPYVQQYRKSQYYDYKYRWGMAIDLDKCTGCGACVVACNAENNIPLAGTKDILSGRLTQWIRIDRYWYGEYPEISSRMSPILCQQCGNAPCEPVCPVAAPFHTNDGLNGQVYNRCIGTRLCAVNCPWKVRIFNWWNHEWDAPLDQQLNPDLSVRWAGVMEKCSFCVQRLRYAKDIAKDEGRQVRDGEVMPACAQTCPSDAMVFGNLLDQESRASKLTRHQRRYQMLHEFNTEPAVVYLKKVRTDAEGEEGEAGGHG